MAEPEEETHVEETDTAAQPEETAESEEEIVLDDIADEDEVNQAAPSTGFVVQAVEEDDKDDQDDAPAFSKGFFAKHK